MGTIDKEHHHASKSSYYTPGHKQFQQGHHNDFKLKRPCNRGGEMYTSELLDFSRFSIEAALASLPGITARNCSIGLEIKSCSVVEPDALDLENRPEDKQKLLIDIAQQQFVTVENLHQLTENDLKNAVDQTCSISDKLLACIDDKPSTIRDAINTFNKQWQLLEQAKESQPIPVQMWRGALRYLHCNIGTWLVSLNESNPATQRYMKLTALVMKDYISSIAALFEDKYRIPFGDHNPEDYLTEEVTET
jgi:hypothetical protein